MSHIDASNHKLFRKVFKTRSNWSNQIGEEDNSNIIAACNIQRRLAVLEGEGLWYHNIVVSAHCTIALAKVQVVLPTYPS